MYLPVSLRDHQPPDLGLSILDQRRTIHCPCCGEVGTLSVAAAARRGWSGFAEDAEGWHVSALCPACSGGWGACCLPVVARCSTFPRRCGPSGISADLKDSAS